jgi:uncharacterized DUF497 family protein
VNAAQQAFAADFFGFPCPGLLFLLPLLKKRLKRQAVRPMHAECCNTFVFSLQCKLAAWLASGVVLKITGFIWLEDIVEKLWRKRRKHGVREEEVVQVFANASHVRFVEKGHAEVKMSMQPLSRPRRAAISACWRLDIESSEVSSVKQVAAHIQIITFLPYLPQGCL